MPVPPFSRVPPDQLNAPDFFGFRSRENLFGRKGSVLVYGRTADMLEVLFPKFDLQDYAARKNRTFDSSDFAVPFLSKEEMELLNGFKAMKKQMEWAAGRFLLKKLAMRYAEKQMELQKIAVAYHDLGAPYLPGFPSLDISLSHCRNITAAAAMPEAAGHIGLDVEHIGRTPGDGFLRTAFTENERKRMGTDPERIFTSWTVKEAFLKLIKKGFNESLHAVEVLDGNLFYHGHPVPVRIDSIRVDSAYVLTVLAKNPS